MSFVTFPGVGSTSAPISVRAEKITAVSGTDMAIIHVEGGETFHVLMAPEIVRATISRVLGDTDSETIEKEV